MPKLDYNLTTVTWEFFTSNMLKITWQMKFSSTFTAYSIKTIKSDTLCGEFLHAVLRHVHSCTYDIIHICIDDP